MRLDHLLSKKMETVRIAFLSNRSLFARSNEPCTIAEKRIESMLTNSLFCQSIRRCRDTRKEHGVRIPRVGMANEKLMMSGGDACRGHTRSHPEHDGQDLRGRWYYVGDDMEEQVAAGLY